MRRFWILNIVLNQNLSGYIWRILLHLFRVRKLKKLGVFLRNFPSFLYTFTSKFENPVTTRKCTLSFTSFPLWFYLTAPVDPVFQPMQKTRSKIWSGDCIGFMSPKKEETQVVIEIKRDCSLASEHIELGKREVQEMCLSSVWGKDRVGNNINSVDWMEILLHSTCLSCYKCVYFSFLPITFN